MTDNIEELFSLEWCDNRLKYVVKYDGIVLRDFDDERDAEEYMEKMINLKRRNQ